MLLIIEGIDGSGKSTLLESLKRHFNDEAHYAFFYEPTHQSKWGKQIRTLLKSEVALSETQKKKLVKLYRKDRYWDIQNNIQPAIKKKRIFLDRYYFSTAAYQGSSLQDAKSIIESYIRDPIILQPNAIFYLDVRPSIALSRIRTRKKQLEIFEHKKTLEQIREKYFHLISTHSCSFPIFILDASRPSNLVFEKFLSYYERFFE